MRRNLNSILVVTALLIFPEAVTYAQSTNPRPLERATEDYQTLLFQRSYRELEQAAVEAHSASSVIDDGQPRLGAIYRGTAGCICANLLTEELWKLRGVRLNEWRERHPK